MKAYKYRLKEKIIYFFLLLFFISVIVFNSFVVIKRIIDANKINNELEEIQEIIHVEDMSNDTVKQEELPKQSEEKTIPIVEENTPHIAEQNTTSSVKLNNDYWNCIHMPLINVNLRDLQNINSETVGFISVSGTNINYPVVQGKDNKYYLKHSFKKGENGSGWLFMDYRNDATNFAENTIIYGHSNLDKTMFGSLSLVLNNIWIDDKENGIIRLVTFNESSLWEIFSAYTIPAESYYIKTEFDSYDEFKKWLETVCLRSKHNFNKNLNESDKVLTLSTCYENEGNVRLVVHARQVNVDYIE